VNNVTVTDLARRIARTHNRNLPPAEFARVGGVIDVAGVRFPIRAHRVSRAEVQAYLDSLGTGPQLSTFDLYGSRPRKPKEYEVPDGL